MGCMYDGSCRRDHCLRLIRGLAALVGPRDAAVILLFFVFFFQAEDGIRDLTVTGVPDVCSSDLSTSTTSRSTSKATSSRPSPMDASRARASTEGRTITPQPRSLRDSRAASA